jgi:hypothetical protein
MQLLANSYTTSFDTSRFGIAGKVYIALGTTEVVHSYSNDGAESGNK